MKAIPSRSHDKLRAERAWLQGQAFGRQGEWQAAAQHYRRAVGLRPSDALFGLNLSDALFKAGRFSEAADAALSVLSVEPGNPIAMALGANALMLSLRFEELVEMLANPPLCEQTPDLLGMRAAAELKIGRAPKAAETYLQALVMRPQDGHMHYRLGLVFNDLQLKKESVECFKTALELGVGDFEVGIRDLMAFFERQVCDWHGKETQVAALKASIARLSPDAAVVTNPFAHVTLLDRPEDLLSATRAYARHLERQVLPLPPRKIIPRDRIRVGYVSSDFHRHATSYLMANFFESHDRSRFEVFLYSHGKDDRSDTRVRIQSAAEHFIQCDRTRVSELANRIRSDGIDILVDLKGYTHESLPEVFAMRPAPLQVAYLGFPGTTGARYIDYLIGDRWVTPLADASHFSEKIAQVPGSYQCNDGNRPIPVAPSRRSQGLPEDALVLCGFNQPYKISPEVFDLWCRLLKQHQHAVLWLLDWQSQASDALLREAQARGVDPARVIFAPSVPQKEHLDRIACADLFLDTWPCNGHTTASDMLWAGVPVVTYQGRTFASRVATSLLHAVGVTDTICSSAQEYEEMAMDLASRTERRLSIRRRLEHARTVSPLFSGARAAREIESLFERMWERACKGLPPDHLEARVDPLN